MANTGFAAGIGIVGDASGAAKELAAGASGASQITWKMFQEAQKSGKDTLAAMQDMHATVVRSVYAFYLNPLVSGAPFPRLKDDDLFDAFYVNPFAVQDMFNPDVTGDDTVRLSQIRNMGRRLIFQARSFAEMVHGQPLFKFGDGTDNDADFDTAAKSLAEVVSGIRASAQSENAFYAFFVDILIALRVGLTFTFAVVATIQRSRAELVSTIPAIAGETPDITTTGPGDERLIEVVSNFSRVLRKAIAEYKLEPLAEFVVNKANNPIVAPIRDTTAQIQLGSLSALAPALNAIERATRRLGITEAGETRTETSLLFDDSKPTDLKPAALVGQLVHALNFHAAYAPRLDFVVENFVLPAYQEVELAFDSSTADADPNTSLFRTLMFIEVNMVEDWSLFCRTTGFFEINQAEIDANNVATTDNGEFLPRPRHKLDGSFPSERSNEGFVAKVYWRSAWMAIEAFTQFASPEGAEQILNAYTAVQMFHAQQGLTPLTSVLNVTDVFASVEPVQDENNAEPIWRTLPAGRVDDIQPSQEPLNALLYGATKALFDNLFVEPTPYMVDGFRSNRLARTAMFLDEKYIPLLIQTVTATLFQCLMDVVGQNRGLNDQTMELAVRVSQPYDPRNRQDLPLPDLGAALQTVAGLAAVTGRLSSAVQGNIVLALWELGKAIVESALISSVVQKGKLVFPPPIADMCCAWLRLFASVMHFDLVTIPASATDEAGASTTTPQRSEQRFIYFDDGIVDDILTVINMGFEQLVAVKQLLDPRERLKRASMVRLESASTVYEEAFVAFYEQPTASKRSDLSDAAQVLAEASQNVEFVYTQTTSPTLVRLIDEYERLLADPNTLPAVLEAAKIALRTELRRNPSALPAAVSGARDLLHTYLDAIKIDSTSC